MKEKVGAILMKRRKINKETLRKSEHSAQYKGGRILLNKVVDYILAKENKFYFAQEIDSFRISLSIFS
jgi:hypothetical protein